MIRYLETVITQSIDETISSDAEATVPTKPPSANAAESDQDFLIRLAEDINSIARTKQVHSRNHFSTCFK
jgi:hypothetical protein